MTSLIIGQEKGNDILTYENALLLYVYGRTTLNCNWFLFLLPNVFYCFHHTIEISIKTLLKLKKISFPDRGPKGHDPLNLLNILVNSNQYSKKVNDLIKNQDLVDLLKVMNTSYTDNKYEYPGYDMRGVALRDLVDEIIFVLFEEINNLLTQQKHALAVLNVPTSLEETFLYKSKVQFTYTLVDMIQY